MELFRLDLDPLVGSFQKGQRLYEEIMVFSPSTLRKMLFGN